MTTNQSNARTLRKVVPIAQRRETGGVTIALSALELYEGGGAILRYLVSYDPTTFEDGGPDEPEMEVRDGCGRSYGWGLDGYGGVPGETEGTLEIYDLPDTGDLDVTVVRLVSTEGPDGEVVEARAGPWKFRLSL